MRLALALALVACGGSPALDCRDTGCTEGRVCKPVEKTMTSSRGLPDVHYTAYECISSTGAARTNAEEDTK